MRKTVFTISLLFALLLILSQLIGACKKEQNTNGLTLLHQQIPDNFPAPLYNFADNPLSEEGFELGRKLFYDPRLSVDNLHPCSSCHEQIGAFGTYQHDRSHGVNNSHTLRNAPVLINLAWSPNFHWDGEFSSVREEAAHPITGQLEMGETFEGVINKIKDDAYYKDAFKKVFRSPFIRPEFIEKALAQFTGSMLAYDSKFDRFKKGQATLTTQEASGYQLYKTKCAGCHPEPMFTDYQFHNIGLPIDPLLNDYGRMRISKNKNDSLKFRTPTLRNTYISSNYMHDGRFNTLGQCINHYRTGIQTSATLDPLLTNGITLTDAEANNLFIFLRALTDSSIMISPRFAKPN